MIRQAAGAVTHGVDGGRRPVISIASCGLSLGVVGGLCVDACKLGVNHDASAIFADDDFFVHLDLHLFLGRYAVEAAAACVALDIYDAEAVAGVFAYAFESCEGAGVYLRLKGFGLFAKTLFILLGLADDLLKFGALLAEYVLLIFELFLGSGDFSGFGVDYACIFVDMLFAEFDFEGLEFNFL